MAYPRVIAAGGGSQVDSLPLDQLFASWLSPRSSILYLPIARDDLQGDFTTCWEWFTTTFAPLHDTNITMWATLEGRSAQDLFAFDSVYIGGGNTWWLLHQFRASGLDAALIDFLRQERPVSGGSAGAILLGCDISTCAHMDPNTVGLIDTRGLDVMGGYAIWCHYMPADDQRIAAYIATRKIPVLALSERAGVYRDGPHLVAAGYDPVIRFAAADTAMYSAGEVITEIQN